MRIFRWLVVISVVLGAITGSGVVYFALLMPAYSFQRWNKRKRRRQPTHRRALCFFTGVSCD